MTHDIKKEMTGGLGALLIAGLAIGLGYLVVKGSGSASGSGGGAMAADPSIAALESTITAMSNQLDSLKATTTKTATPNLAYTPVTPASNTLGGYIDKNLGAPVVVSPTTYPDYYTAAIPTSTPTPVVLAT